MLGAGLLTSCGFRAKKYDDPITKDTKQPDKVLFDRAINDIEHGRYEIARITLNTLINTYDQSEYLAKAKLAIADSWYREGGAANLAQAEAEYKDFILFYPTMEEAAESQEKICMIHYKQMEKVDRDQSQALRAEDECRQLVVQFPNSKYVDETKQLLRNIQEAIAEGEYEVGEFYLNRGDNSAAANRFSHVVEQYPLYSRADVALWDLAQAYKHLGTRFRRQEGEAYSRIVRDYPLSDFASDSVKRLKQLEMPVPEPDKAALARMQFEKDHRVKESMFKRDTMFLKRGPDMTTAAREGDPAMVTLKPSIPPLVPQPGGAGGTGFGTVTAQPVSNSSALDTQPDARTNPPAAAGATGSTGATGTVTNQSGTTPAAADAAPASQQTSADQPNGKKKKSKKQKKQQQPAAADPPASPAPSN